MPNIRLGTASPSTQATTAATLALIESIAQRAAAKSIDILLLPEAFLGGYPRGSGFGCVVGDRTQEGRDDFARYFEAAIDLGDTVGIGGAGAGDRWLRRELGPDSGGSDHKEDGHRGDGTREELERIARDTGVFFVTGVVERSGGSLYCAAVYVCPKLGIIGKRRKVMPTGTERLIWAQGSPATLKAVSTTIHGVRINLAAAICWESYMPLLRQALYSQNINLYLAPTADGRDAWLSLMRTVGLEGRCFVVSSNMCVRGSASEPQQQHLPSRGRDRSVFSEGGRSVEIALPPKASSPSQRKRRKSVFDEDGNEIVLCCPQDGEGAEDDENVNGTGHSPKANGRADATSAKTNGAAGSWVSRSGSSIVSPFGDVVAGPQWEDDEGLIYADVDFRDSIRGRLDFDAGGSYSRNDSFNFSVTGLNLDPLPY